MRRNAKPSAEQAKEAKVIKMTTEPVEKLVLCFAVPTMISMLVTAFYNLADTFFVRQLNSDSMVAAVGVVMPLMNIIQAIGFYHGHGSGNYISRAYGRRELQDAEIMASTGFFCAMSFGVVLAVFGLMFRSGLAHVLGAKTPDTVQNSIRYMTWILLAAPLMMGSIVMNNQLRLQGNAFFSMIGLTSGAILNLFLDPMLIFRAGDSIGAFGLRASFGAGVRAARFLRGRSRRFRRGACHRHQPVRQLYGAGHRLQPQRQCKDPPAELLPDTEVPERNPGRRPAFTGKAGNRQRFHRQPESRDRPVCRQRDDDRCRAGRHDRREPHHDGAGVASHRLWPGIPAVTNLVAGASREAADIAVFAFRAQLVTLPLQAWVVLCNMMLQNIGATGKATLLAISRQGLAFIPMVLLLPLLTGALGAAPLLGIELAQPASDVISLLIAIPVGLSELKKMADA